jgi:hypothetical protein
MGFTHHCALFTLVRCHQIGKVFELADGFFAGAFVFADKARLLAPQNNMYSIHLTRSIVKGIQSRCNGDKAHAHGYACNQTKEYKQQYAFGL